MSLIKKDKSIFNLLGLLLYGGISTGIILFIVNTIKPLVSEQQLLIFRFITIIIAIIFYFITKSIKPINQDEEEDEALI